MASAYLSRTPSSTGNDKIATFSAWVKRGSSLGSQNNIFTSFPANERTQLFFTPDATLKLQAYVSGSATTNLETTMKLRDVNGWYHIVVAMDSTQATNTNRVKIYVNGVQQTISGTYLNQNTTLSFNTSGRPFYIGTYDTSQLFFDGEMAHVHWIDGTAYQASTFGETDSTTGIWKPKTSPTVTYGTNGFFLKFENSGAMGTDSAGSNNFAVNGTMTQLKDTPSNVFATINPLDNGWFSGTFSNGNNTVVSNASKENYWTSTLGASSGKYYWEVKLSSSGSGRDYVGIADKISTTNAFSAYSGNSKMRSYYGYTGVSVIGSTGSAFGNTFGTGDIIGVAMDLDNHKLYFSKNGVFQNSQNPATGTNGLAIDTSPESGFYYAQAGNIHNTSTTFQVNFGNGYFGTTAVSSAGANASGNGIFEYDVPTGYTALSTKGLNL